MVGLMTEGDVVRRRLEKAQFLLKVELEPPDMHLPIKIASEKWLIWAFALGLSKIASEITGYFPKTAPKSGEAKK